MDAEEDAEHERRERLARIGEVAAEVAHELRNCLQIISANVYLARQDPAKSAAQLGKIDKQARLAQGIVDDLMALARGEPAHAEPVVLSDVLAAAREDLPEGVVYEDELDPARLEVRAHHGLLVRCLHVLYENAIHASAPRPPTIVTRARLEPGRAIIEVADDGPGVPPEVAATVFEPLVSARRGGTGLGLALARRIAAAHGGTIVLLDLAPGATFRIELPAR
ncbi:MAG: sensor histidine kinase [Labilithrix sp.]|nr:sensor histidine kinase [Labilithrix sp.]